MKKVLLEMERLRDLNSGLGQFCLGLGKALAEKAVEMGLIFYVPEGKKGIFGTNHKYVPVSKMDRFFGISSHDIDICHCTHQQSPYLPRRGKTKLILTIHDLNFLYKYKSGFRKRLKIQQLQKKINRASAITFISKFTESEARNHLKIPAIPTKVVYNGNTLKYFERPLGKIPEGKYLFSIGIIQPKKNFHVLVSLLSPDNELKLIIAGRQEEAYTAYIKQIAVEAGVADKLIFTGNIDEERKFHLFNNCYAFVFPSLSEGFGLPVIEAMSLGKPVFISRLTSLPEVGGPEAYYFDDFSASSMRESFESGMADYIQNPGKANKIKEWASQFTWENAAGEYLKLYRQLLDEA
jgi:glycosyltransferase involved in cell wall biosynthesis